MLALLGKLHFFHSVIKVGEAGGNLSLAITEQNAEDAEQFIVKTVRINIIYSHRSTLHVIMKPLVKVRVLLCTNTPTHFHLCKDFVRRNAFPFSLP